MSAPQRLRVNPIACSGHGLCAELLPEIITLDEWGCPVIADTSVSGSLSSAARRAVTLCPALALSLTPGEPESSILRGFSEEARTVARAAAATL